MKGNYKKGTIITVEHRCFNFKPPIVNGDKLYFMIFATQYEMELIYLTFSEIGFV